MTAVRTLADSLSRDLAAWKDGAGGPPLDKHASQVESMVDQLTTALAELPAGRADPAATQAILDYHHIWDFFRTKLALRFVPWYQPLLAAADDLAWAAWRPMRDAARDRSGVELREPPLVYFSRAAVPFAVPRGEDYRDLLPRGGIYTADADEVAKALVVPVISLPWHRTNWLPVVLSVAHEVGHVLVADLGLPGWLAGRIAAADLPAGRRDAWAAWAEEVWADVFAAVVCGSATALSLAGQLGGGDGGEPAGPRWGDYPPAALRLRLIDEVARRRGGPVAHRATAGAFDADVPAVAAALLDQDLPGAGRPESHFPPVDTDATLDEADRLGRRREPLAGEVRALLAAATMAVATAAGPDDRAAVQEAALTRAGQIRDVGRRSRSAADAAAAAGRGHRLAALLTPGPGAPDE